VNKVLNDETVSFVGHTIYCDSETIDLYGAVRLVQIYCPTLNAENVYLFDTYEYPLILIRKRILEASKSIWHNGKYDFDCLGITPKEWDDTYILDTILNYQEDKHTLDDVATRALGYNPYEGFNKKMMQKSDWSGVLTEEQLNYAATDVWILPEMMEYMDVEKAGWTYILDKRTVEAFTKMGQRLPIDVEGLAAHRIDNLKRIAEINVPINVNSWKQVRAYIEYDKSDDDALALLASQGNQRAYDVRAVRSLRKQISFINKFEAERRGNYIYGHLNIGTRSGRSKCSNMNLQQIPQAFKKYVKSEKYMVYADFAQLELRSLCVLIGEEVFEKLFRNQTDLHDYVKESLFGADDTQEVSDAGRGNSLRQIAKIYNFASLYGAGWATIGKTLMKYTGLSLSEHELKVNRKKWLDTFPGVKAWHAENVRHWQKKRPLHTPMGRKYIGKLPTDTNNIMNQGLGAEVAKLALVYMDKDMDLSKFLMFVHDSYTAEYDTLEEAKEACVTMANCMCKAWFDITKNCKITDLPMPVQAFIGKDWKTIDKSPIAEYAVGIDGIGRWIETVEVEKPVLLIAEELELFEEIPDVE